jgi:hypothetical protein
MLSGTLTYLFISNNKIKKRTSCPRSPNCKCMVMVRVSHVPAQCSTLCNKMCNYFSNEVYLLLQSYCTVQQL